MGLFAAFAEAERPAIDVDNEPIVTWKMSLRQSLSCHTNQIRLINAPPATEPVVMGPEARSPD